MDHLMKKSLSMGDISQQQAGGQQITYRPAAQQIPEEVDEPGIVICYSYELLVFWMYHYITIVN